MPMTRGTYSFKVLCQSLSYIISFNSLNFVRWMLSPHLPDGNLAAVASLCVFSMGLHEDTEKEPSVSRGETLARKLTLRTLDLGRYASKSVRK